MLSAVVILFDQFRYSFIVLYGLGQHSLVIERPEGSDDAVNHPWRENPVLFEYFPGYFKTIGRILAAGRQCCKAPGIVILVYVKAGIVGLSNGKCLVFRHFKSVMSAELSGERISTVCLPEVSVTVLFLSAASTGLASPHISLPVTHPRGTLTRVDLLQSPQQIFVGAS